MSETLTPRSLSRRRFVQSSGALLFAAQCPAGLSGKAYAGGAGAMMNSFVRIDPTTSLRCWRIIRSLVTAPTPS